MTIPSETALVVVVAMFGCSNAAKSTTERGPTSASPVAADGGAIEMHRPLRENEKELDVAAFRHSLQCGAPGAEAIPSCEGAREASGDIESVRVEPGGHGEALFVVAMRPTFTKDVGYAPFPSAITDEMTAASVAYVVRNPSAKSTPIDSTASRIDAMTFRQLLQCIAPGADAIPKCKPDAKTRVRIERIRIQPLGRDSARYILAFGSGTEVTYAEYPGRIIDEIKAAGVPFEIENE